MQPNTNGPVQPVQSADDVVRMLLEHFQRRPLLETVAAFLDELDRYRTEPFRQCMASKSRVSKLIHQAMSEQYVLAMLKHIRLDPQLIRPQVEQRLPTTYLLLKPEQQQMQQTTDPTKRQQLALRNLYKIELLYEFIIRRYQVEPPAYVLLTFITLMPGDLNLRRHVELFGEIVSRIIKLQKTFEVEYVFELAASEFSGSGSMAAVLMKHSMKAPVLADRLLQFCQQKNRELSRLLRTLAKNYKTVKFYDMCCEIAARLQQRPDQLVELFRSFVKPQVLKDIARDMMYCEGERVVKALLQNPKTNFTGTLNAEQFHWLVSNINKNYICEHIVLLQMLAKRCLPTNLVETYNGYLEKYLEPHQKQQQQQKKQQQQQQQLATTMPDLSKSKGMMNAVSAKDLFSTQGDLSGITYKPKEATNPTNTFTNFHQNGNDPYGISKPTSAKQHKSPKQMYPQSSKEMLLGARLFNKPNEPQKLPAYEPPLASICTDYIGLPNIGNSCYINAFFIALYFCRQFSGNFFHSKPNDLTLQYLRSLLIHLYHRQRKQTLAMVTSLKKTLPEEFSSSSVQQDTMEFGRLMLDKITSCSNDLKKMFEMQIEETILCPKGDIIEKRKVTEFFMILSFQDPKLFSKLESKVGGEIDLNSMIIRDYFTPTVIEGDFQCEVCKCKFNKRQKRQKIISMPPILIVVLSRFTYDIGRSARRKVCDRVRVDNWLLFGNITEATKPDNYKLTSFINHLGKNAESGHYQSYVRYPKQDNRWLNFDDDFVTEAYQGRVMEFVRGFNQFDTPYVLFYERQQ